MLRPGRDGGVVLSVNGFSAAFDTRPQKGLGFVSHAHSDHVATGRNIIATRETISLIRKVWQIPAGYRPIRYREAIRLSDSVSVQAFNSGHVLGSAMFRLDVGGETLVYTGDINTVQTLTTIPAEPVDADILVIETTYGHPDYVFPPRHETMAWILKWVSKTLAEGDLPAFKAYSIGKSQELIKLFNTYTSLPVVVGKTVANASNTYVENGVKLDFMRSGTREAVEVLGGGEAVYIDSQARGVPVHRRVRWATVTGWAVRGCPEGFDAAFPLSSHADYRGLLNYVEENRPKKVYTIHGFSQLFANMLRRQGFDATPFT
ncbi:MAG: MBL fold metallo-hydrolase [Candidatus Caldarchaeum sp.]